MRKIYKAYNVKNKYYCLKNGISTSFIPEKNLEFLYFLFVLQWLEQAVKRNAFSFLIVLLQPQPVPRGGHAAAFTSVPLI